MTVVIAHRTCPRDAAENSLSGIRRAAELRADLVEIDVRLTRGGEPVLVHDAWLLRTAWLPLPVRLVPASMVTRMPLRGGDGETVPTLAEALRSLPPHLGAAIDVKDAAAMPAVIAAVRSAGVADRVLLWSQHPTAVQRAVELLPGVEVALLRDTTDDDATRRYLENATALGASAVSVHESVLSNELVASAHDRGLRVYCWVQDALRTGAAVATGLDGVVTDWPLEARAAVDR